MTRMLFRTILLASTILSASAAYAHDQAKPTELKQFGNLPHASDLIPSGASVPLWTGLGSRTYPITTSSSEAQRYFDQGLTLAFGFNHWEAQRSFRAAQAVDPNCAMCFWGEALVLGPNINWPMEDAARAPALAALAEAKRLAPNASEKEQALIAALGKRYSDDPSAERAALDRAYADAMQEVAARFPEDLDITTLYAESLMDLSPWDYWADGGKSPKGRTAELVATIERVLAADADHIGAIHLYIHTVEASDRPKRAEPYADRLAAQRLSTGHLVHMPSHIYYRVGRYADSLEANKAAVAADEAYLAQVEAEGIYPGGYYPHNIHFLLVSAQMAGDGETAVAAAEKLDKAISDDVARQVPWVQPVKAAPLFAHAQFSTPDTILAIPQPHADFPYVVAMWHYARGVAYAAQGDSAGATLQAEAIAEIGESADFSGLTSGGVPADDLLKLARHVVLARIAQSEGKLEASISEFEAAAEIEKSLPYMEPPFWYYPVKQSLGAVLLLAGETERAEEIFRASLTAAPNNGWACFGLLEVHKRRGEVAAAEALKERLDRTWAGDRSLLDLERL
ncbi:MAG: tetratricopeptide repeat protein [Propylenella sp.]